MYTLYAPSSIHPPTPRSRIAPVGLGSVAVPAPNGSNGCNFWFRRLLWKKGLFVRFALFRFRFRFLRKRFRRFRFRFTNLQFPSAVILSAVGRRKTRNARTRAPICAKERFHVKIPNSQVRFLGLPVEGCFQGWGGWACIKFGPLPCSVPHRGYFCEAAQYVPVLAYLKRYVKGNSAGT